METTDEAAAHGTRAATGAQAAGGDGRDNPDGDAPDLPRPSRDHVALTAEQLHALLRQAAG